MSHVRTHIAAVDNIAKGLATAHPGQYSNPDSATAAARQQLVQALYDGVLVAEGDSRELVAPDSHEPGRGISGARQTIPTRYWANESRQETTLSGDGAAITVLDLVIVHWSADSIIGDDDYGDYELQNVRLVLEALQRLALLAPPTLPNSCDTEPMRLARNSALSDQVTYFTGAPGRPTSTHLVEAEMRRRFAAGEQASSMRLEAEQLSAIISSKYPMAARITPKTIQNRFGALFRQLRAKIPK